MGKTFTLPEHLSHKFPVAGKTERVGAELPIKCTLKDGEEVTKPISCDGPREAEKPKMPPPQCYNQLLVNCHVSRRDS